jgi:hypothetical protein
MQHCMAFFFALRVQTEKPHSTTEDAAFLREAPEKI